MKEYKALQIIKHALAYYIGREGASKTDTDTEKLLLATIEERAEELREHYRIPKKTKGAAAALTPEPEDRGQWEEWTATGGLFCSKCHNDAPISRLTGKQYKANFCPFCGRPMETGAGT